MQGRRKERREGREYEEWKAIRVRGKDQRERSNAVERFNK